MGKRSVHDKIVMEKEKNDRNKRILLYFPFRFRSGIDSLQRRNDEKTIVDIIY